MEVVHVHTRDRFLLLFRPASVVAACVFCRHIVYRIGTGLHSRHSAARLAYPGPTRI